MESPDVSPKQPVSQRLQPWQEREVHRKAMIYAQERETMLDGDVYDSNIRVPDVYIPGVPVIDIPLDI